MLAKRTIEHENPNLTTVIETKDSLNLSVKQQFCCNRVIIYVTHGVVDIPFPCVG
ncbi:Inhibitor of trypsin and hageman factor [Bienertia sinuspersici]